MKSSDVHDMKKQHAEHIRRIEKSHKAVVTAVVESYIAQIAELNARITELESTAQLVSEPYKLPSGWKLVPIEPTENMIIEGFESEPDEFFSKSEVWEEYAAMSGCEQAAHRAKLCWAAMLAAAPTPQKGE
ncbi:hypothetical protein VU677_18895 [Hafnia paralvei]|uniref:hypothetical protein n=1 Tax=Hafnia paralvei TaxID=546367 RepID=UPI00300D08DE